MTDAPFFLNKHLRTLASTGDAGIVPSISQTVSSSEEDSATPDEGNPGLAVSYSQSTKLGSTNL